MQHTAISLEVLQRLAAGLCQQAWSQPSLSLHLSQRLPVTMSRLATPLSKRLMRAFPKSSAPDIGLVIAFLRTDPSAKRLSDFVRKTGNTPLILLSPPNFRPAPALSELSLPSLATPMDLADWLGISSDMLVRFADLRGLSARTDNAFAPHYHHHLIPKKNGQLRLIEEPKPLLKHLHRRILQGILNQVPPHDATYGFRIGRNCIMAAARHAGEAVVVSFDLRDFFANIPFTRIYSLFRALGYPQHTARDLTGLCTAITPPKILKTPHLAGRDPLSNRHLPQGAPTSPALANLCALALDRRLNGLARSLGATYTRYADDLTFSGDDRIAEILLRAVPQIITAEGFATNQTKTRLARAHQRQTVTGLTVNRGVNTPRQTYDLLKATLHHLANPDDPRRQNREVLAQLSGQIAWVEQVNPMRGLRLRQSFDAIVGR